MPFRDEAEHLPAQLAALAHQDYAGAWELVGVDDGSVDDSAAIVEGALAEHGWRGTVVSGPGRGPGPARNAGVVASEGDLVCFCDADDVVDGRWLGALVGSAERGASLVAGALERHRLNPDVFVRSRGRPGSFGFAPSGNMAVWRSVFDEVGGFDPTFRQGEDVDFTLRARAAGHELVAAPDAVVHYRYRTSARRAFRQGYRTGYYGRRLRRRHPGSPELSGPTMSIPRQVGWLCLRLPTVLSSRRRRLFVVRLGSLLGQLGDWWGSRLGAAGGPGDRSRDHGSRSR